MMNHTIVLLAAAALLFGSVSRAEETPRPASAKLRPALLVIDVQKAFLPYMSEQDQKTAPMMINGAIGLFRAHGFPVIRVYHTDPQWGPPPDSDAFQFSDAIQVKPEDTQVIKNYPSSFRKTDLERILREKGCNTLFLCGLSATGCVLATYHGAAERDFNVFMLKGALISPNTAHTEMIESISETLTYEGLRVLLDSAGP